MISSVRDPVIMQQFPNHWIPAGVLIVLAVLAFGFLGDSLRDAFDPKAKR
jgi:peptide/nickel transport system permease protein